MKAAIYVTKKPTEGLQQQVEQAYALVDERGWEMVRMVHQDEFSDESKAKSFYEAAQAGEFQVLAVPSLDVFSDKGIELLNHFNIELEVYTPRDPAEVERERLAKEAHARKEAQIKERKQAQLEAMAAEPWKAKLMDAFLKKGS